MKRITREYINGLAIIMAFLSLFITWSANAQTSPPVIDWQKCFGGSNLDEAFAVVQTTDGGYVLAGKSNSSDSGMVTNDNLNNNFWIIKLNSSGTLQWQKNIGGGGDDKAYSIKQTTDGGYIVVGSSESSDGDVTNNNGKTDFWIVKLDSNGAVQWQESFGGSNDERANSVQQTADGGYIVAGYTSSSDGDVTSNLGQCDCWIIKLDNTGALVWQKTIGGTGNDMTYSIQQTSDGGYIMAGCSSSNNGDVSGNHGFIDFWVVKLTSTGSITWQKSLGGSENELAYAVQQTSDGGYIVCGYTFSNDGNVSGKNTDVTSPDTWIVKLNSTGSIVWQKCFGGTSADIATTVQQTSDGGYIMAGSSASTDAPVTGNHGAADYWLVKLNSSGTLQWQKSLGGSNDDVATSIKETSDGGFIVIGSSSSTDGDVTGNHGAYDIWVVKLVYPGAGL